MKAYGLCAVNEENEILHAVLFANFPNDKTFDEIEEELRTDPEWMEQLKEEKWRLRYMTEAELEKLEKLMDYDCGKGTFDNLMEKIRNEN